MSEVLRGSDVNKLYKIIANREQMNVTGTKDEGGLYYWVRVCVLNQTCCIISGEE